VGRLDPEVAVKVLDNNGEWREAWAYYGQQLADGWWSDTTTDWARQQVLGARASFASHPNIKDWVDAVSRNSARIPPELAGCAAPPAGGAGDGQDGRARRHVVGLADRGNLAGP
jgi:hypothetical protein